MKNNGSCLVALAAVLQAALLLSPVQACAGEGGTGGKVLLTADELRQDWDRGIFEASGQVEIRWDGTTLYAAMATFDQGSSEAVASGGVRLVKEGDRLLGKRLRLNVATQEGEVQEGDLFLKQPNFHVRGASMAKTGPSDYRLAQGRFTTCDGDSPSWSFAADDLQVTLEEYATGRHAFFYVGPVPVFYTPYILFPVKRERQSGFLFPRLGSSGKKGVFLDTPFYWAISPSRDATIDLDLQSKRGAGLGLDYRYLSRDAGSGHWRSYLIYDQEKDTARGELSLQQQESFGAHTIYRADLNLALDRDYYRDYGVTSGEYNRQYLESTAFVTHYQIPAFQLTGAADYLTDLDAVSNRLTLQQLPRISLTGPGQRLGSLPLYLTLDSSFTNFYRQEGETGERIAFRPRVTAALPVADGLGLTAWGGFYQRLYRTDSAREESHWSGSGLAEGGVSLASAVDRVYDVAWGGITRVRHLLLPELRYEYRQLRNQDALPFFDFDDRPLAGQLLTWSLGNFLTAKSTQGETASYRELAFLRLSQSYQLSGPTRDSLSGSPRDLLTLVDDDHPWTDIRLEGRVAPYRQLSLSGDSRFSPYRGGFSTAGVSMQASDERGSTASLGYRLARQQLEYLEGKVTMAALKPYVFTYGIRYSFDRGGPLESFYSAEYKHQCWSLTLSYRDRPDNREFLVNFNLAGLGSLGSIKAF